MNTPDGLEAIVSTFGDVRTFIDVDGHLLPDWQQQYLGRATLPFSMPLDWERSVTVSRMLCHKLLVPVFEKTFEDVVSAGLQDKLKTYGGCFAFRPQRTGNKLSTHCWGIGIDLNPYENAQGTLGNMHPDVVAIFRKNGFKWGGDWYGRAKDPMHYQFATGY